MKDTSLYIIIMRPPIWHVLCWLQALCIDHLTTSLCKQDSVAMARQGSPALGFPTSNTSKCIADSRKRIWDDLISRYIYNSYSCFWIRHHLNCCFYMTRATSMIKFWCPPTSAWTYAPPWLVDVRSHHGLPLQRLTWLLHREINSEKQAVNVTHADCALWCFQSLWTLLDQFNWSPTEVAWAKYTQLQSSRHAHTWLTLDCFAKSRVLKLFWFFQLL